MRPRSRLGAPPPGRATLATLLLVAFAATGAAQEPSPGPSPDGPRVTVTLDPDGAVTVGTPLEVEITVLVPTFMPSPPVWPDLQVADAITRLPERATHPVTERVAGESWAGIVRSWEIIPQRVADYDLGDGSIRVTYADPETSQPVEASVALPAIAFSARLPAGAEGMDPFLPASTLTLERVVDGLPAQPKPGDAFTLTLTTTASGPPAILLPPLLPRIAVPEGLRAYPKEPVVTDTPGTRGGPSTATRVEAVTYVIEAPGTYQLPAVSLDWWDTTRAVRETAATEPLAVTVPPPPGWHAPGAPDTTQWWRDPWLWIVLAVVACGVATARHRGAAGPRPPTERSLYLAACRAIRKGPPAQVRDAVAAWLSVASPQAPRTPPEIEAALRALERTAYGPAGGAPRDARTALRATVAAHRRGRTGVRDAARRHPLPAINECPLPSDGTPRSTGSHRVSWHGIRVIRSVGE